MESVNSAMSLAEAKGHLADPSHYREQISLEKENKKSLKKERNRLQKELNNAVASGKIKKFSPEWREMAQAIYEVDQALGKSLENLQNFSNQLRQIQFDRFDYLQEQM